MLIGSHAKQLDALIAEHSLGTVAETIRNGAYSRVDFSFAGDETYAEVGNSRFGGDPDLPRDCPWIDKIAGLVFLVQVSLSDIPAAASLGLPSHGMLYIFSDDGGYEGSTFYFPGDSAALARHRMPIADPDYIFGSMKCLRIKAALGIDLPGQGSSEFDEIEEYGLEDEYEALDEQLRFDWDNTFCQLAGRHPDLDADVRKQAANARGGSHQDWRSLWKILSSLKSGLVISDHHVMHGVITNEDLRSKTFDNVYSECGVV